MRFVFMALLIVSCCSAGAPNHEPAAPAGKYEIVVKDAVVSNSKSSGAGWDAAGNAPDPYVIVGVREPGKGKTFKSSRQTSADQDTHRPDWNETTITVDVGDDLTIQVWDEDIASDDFVGEKKFTVTRKMIEEGELILSFGQVSEIRIAFREP